MCLPDCFSLARVTWEERGKGEEGGGNLRAGCTLPSDKGRGVQRLVCRPGSTTTPTGSSSHGEDSRHVSLSIPLHLPPPCAPLEPLVTRPIESAPRVERPASRPPLRLS